MREKRTYVNACRKGCETSTDVEKFKVNGIIKEIREMRVFFTACRKRYEIGNHVTQLKANGIIEKLDK